LRGTFGQNRGRLTLNVLLSFAKFEREFIGERIRDKIAREEEGDVDGRSGPCIEAGSAGDHDHSGDAERSCPQPVKIYPSAPRESDPDPIVDQERNDSADANHDHRKGSTLPRADEEPDRLPRIR